MDETPKTTADTPEDEPQVGSPDGPLDASAAGGPEASEVAPEAVLTAEALADLRKKAEERDLYLDELLRSKAELDNFQKRVRRERPALEEQAVGRFLRDLLPVVDNFDRASESLATTGGDCPALAEGIRLIHQMLQQVLTESGVEEILAESQPFDPECHEAMVQEEVEDRPTGEIVDVLEKGYRYRSLVLRPSKVKVALNVSQGSGGAGDAGSGDTSA